MKPPKPVHALYRPRRDGSAYTWCGRLVRRAAPSRGPKPVRYVTAMGERYRAVRPGFGTPTCKVCLQVVTG